MNLVGGKVGGPAIWQPPSEPSALGWPGGQPAGQPLGSLSGQPAGPPPGQIAQAPNQNLVRPETKVQFVCRVSESILKVAESI